MNTSTHPAALQYCIPVCLYPHSESSLSSPGSQLLLETHPASTPAHQGLDTLTVPKENKVPLSAIEAIVIISQIYSPTQALQDAFVNIHNIRCQAHGGGRYQCAETQIDDTNLPEHSLPKISICSCRNACTSDSTQIYASWRYGEGTCDE